MFSGIYRIYNYKAGKTYVGSAVTLHRRINEHKRLLRSNRHPNPHLQRSFNQDASAFIFEILELVTEKCLLIEREQFWIEAFRSHHSSGGYNICPIAGNSLGVKHSEETRRKVSDAQRGKKRPEEFRLKMSRIGFERKPPTAETRRKMSLAKLGKAFHCKPHTDEAKKKMSEALSANKRCGPKHHNYGKPMPEHVKQALREANLGRARSEETKLKMAASQQLRREREKIAKQSATDHITITIV